MATGVSVNDVPAEVKLWVKDGCIEPAENTVLLAEDYRRHRGFYGNNRRFGLLKAPSVHDPLHCCLSIFCPCGTIIYYLIVCIIEHRDVS